MQGYKYHRIKVEWVYKTNKVESVEKSEIF